MGGVRVRTTRQGRVLVVGGSFASLLKPGQSTTDSIWDLMGAARLLFSPGGRMRVAVLGLGGGSVVRLLRAIDPGCAIVAVEKSPEVVATARRDFGIDSLGVRVVTADAARWLSCSRPESFDLVVDDVFVGSTQSLRKPPGWEDALGHAWRVVRPAGLLAVNVVTAEQERLRAVVASAPAVRLRLRGYDNRVWIAAKRPSLDASWVRGELRSSPLLGPLMNRVSVRTLPAC